MDYIPPYKVKYVRRGSYDKEVLSESNYKSLSDRYPCCFRIADSTDEGRRLIKWKCDILYGPYNCPKCKFRKIER